MGTGRYVLDLSPSSVRPALESLCSRFGEPLGLGPQLPLKHPRSFPSLLWHGTGDHTAQEMVPLSTECILVLSVHCLASSLLIQATTVVPWKNNESLNCLPYFTV